MSALIHRKPWGQGFTYQYEKGRTLKKESLKDWIKSLAIPPAWKNVWIDTDKDAKIHAWGRDSKNKKQYIYNDNWRSQREAAKFDRIIEFADKLTHMRRVTAQHLRDKTLTKRKVLACMTRLLDEAYFRAGSKYYAKEHGTYGLTTLRSKHLDISKDHIEFHYQGKSGKEQKKMIEADKLIQVIEELDELKGYRIFKYINQNNEIKSLDRDDLNQYIKKLMGDDFTAKDFRTWAGTFLAATLLDKLDLPKKSMKQKKEINKVIDKVALHLGNTRSIAKSSYIDPRVIQLYQSGSTIKNILNNIKLTQELKQFSNKEERAVVELIKSYKEN
ncbi:MAG: DNA topoisomerase [Halobacteriovoraceae bacterium]|nr:DNA topoisomerase [Halobacteriovoraceae bacterium]|tara:strand:+ start:18792 stop:19781 length:990 start_codon:yes stop_codon:yes gene_type:complete